MEKEGAEIEFNENKHLLGKEEKERIMFEVNAEINKVSDKLNELAHTISHLFVGKKNSENYVDALNRNTDNAISETKDLICKLENLKGTLKNIETEKF